MLLLLKAGSNWKKYFINRRTLLTNGFFGSLFVSFENNMKLSRILKRDVLQNIQPRGLKYTSCGLHAAFHFVQSSIGPYSILEHGLEQH